jgi:hypothetical protein
MIVVDAKLAQASRNADQKTSNFLISVPLNSGLARVERALFAGPGGRSGFRGAGAACQEDSDQSEESESNQVCFHVDDDDPPSSDDPQMQRRPASHFSRVVRPKKKSQLHVLNPRKNRLPRAPAEFRPPGRK